MGNYFGGSTQQGYTAVWAGVAQPPWRISLQRCQLILKFNDVICHRNCNLMVVCLPLFFYAATLFPITEEYLDKKKKKLPSLSIHLNYSHRNESLRILLMNRMVYSSIRMQLNGLEDVSLYVANHDRVSTTFMLKHFWLHFIVRANRGFPYFIWLHFETSFDGKHKS